jgi:DNA (cytosine-5)-methyltransferase 1
MEQVPKLRAVDLFCGAGGLSYGLEAAGFDVVAALDSWGPAARTYRSNFGHPLVEGDVRSLSVAEFERQTELTGTVDLVAGGPPCQGFSIQRIGSDEDGRNDLVFEFLRYVLGIRPRAFVMENVPGLVGKRGSEISTAFERMVAEGGYEVRSRVVDAADYGVPQHRRRVLYYGWPSGGSPISIPRPTHAAADHVTVWDAIGDLPSPPEDPRAETPDLLHRRSRMSELNVRRLMLIPPGGGFEHLPIDLRVAAHRDGPDRIGHRGVYGRLDPNKPAGTITARFDSFTRGKFAHPYEHRNITLREGARLQTFPDNFSFHGNREDIAALIGNAIPPRLANLIGRAVADGLRDDGSSVPVMEDQLRLFAAAVDR